MQVCEIKSHLQHQNNPFWKQNNSNISSSSIHYKPKMSAVTLLNWSSWRWLSPPWQVKTWSVKWVDWWSSPVWPSLTRLICSYRHPHHLRCHHYIRCHCIHLHYSVVVVITMNIINDSWSDHHSPICSNCYHRHICCSHHQRCQRKT